MIVKWISMEDRQPDREDNYIVYTTTGRIRQARWYNDGKVFQCNIKATHWMEFPEPPREGKHERVDKC